MTVKTEAYHRTIRPLTERELAGILKYHPEHKRQIMNLVSHVSCKFMETLIKYDKTLSDDDYLQFLEALENNTKEIIKEREQNSEENAYCEKNTPEYIKAKEMAIKFIESGEKDTSELSLREAQDPDQTIDIYNMFGWNYKRKKQYEFAIASFTRAHKYQQSFKESNLPIYLLYRAEVYIDMEEYEKAIADLNEAVEIEPIFFNPIELRANVYEIIGDYEYALADWMKVLERELEMRAEYQDEDHVSEFNQMFEKYWRMNIDRCKKYISTGFKPKDTEAKNGRCSYCGVILIGKDECFNCGKKINGKGFSLLREFNTNLAFSGYSEDLVKFYSECIALNHSHFDRWSFSLDKSNCYMKRGYAYCQNEQYDEAFSDFSKAIELNPKKTEIYYQRADIYTTIENYEKAILDYSKLIEMDPNNYNFYEKRAEIYFLNKQYNEAVMDYSSAYQLACEYWGNDEFIRDDEYDFTFFPPDIVSILDKRSLVYKEMGELESAFSDIKKALEIEPENASLYETCALLYEEVNDFNKALLNWETALDIKNRLDMESKDEDPDYYERVLSVSFNIFKEYIDLNRSRCIKKLNEKDISRFGKKEVVYG